MLLLQTVGTGMMAGGALGSLGMSGLLKGGAFSHGIGGFLDNPLVQGGLVMGILMWAWNMIKTSPQRIMGFAKNKTIVTVTLRGISAKRFLLEWLAAHPYGKKTKNVALCNEWERGRNVPIIQAGYGDHIVKYKGKRLWIKIEKDDKKKVDAWAENPDNFNITINTFRGGRSFIEQFVQDIWDNKNKDVLDKLMVEKYSSGHWENFGMTDRRCLNSLIFDSDTPARILDDIRHFENEKEWYQSMDIPHNRGFLLYGEPGNGKSSLVRAIATELNKSIATFSLTDVYHDSDLLQAITKTPKNSILLIEDVDAIFSKPIVNDLADISSPQSQLKGKTNKGLKSSSQNDDNETSTPEYNRDMDVRGISFSGILNALDGIMTSQSRIMFMTTNRKERLDAALIRPGRIDKTIYIGNATTEQIRQFYVRFFPEDTNEQAVEFVARFKDRQKSMAEIQEILLGLKEQRRHQFLPEKVNT